MPERIDPAMWSRSELQAALIGHDIGALYRALNKAGVSQRRIAALTGTTQSQVADIVAGRRARVIAYDVLVRNAEGLGIPRERMGLSFWGPDGGWYGSPETYPGEVAPTRTPREVTAQMLRRHLIAFGGIILAGVPVDKVGELLDDLGALPPVSLPSRLGPEHVTQVRELTRRLGVGEAYCPYPVLNHAAGYVTPLLGVSGPEKVTQPLQVAVAELHIEAAWAALDAGHYHPALYHFARALELARQAGDAYCQAYALGCAGLASTEHGHPDDGLKMLQAAQAATWGIPSDDQRAVVVGESGRTAVEACQLVTSARALALLGEHDQAARALAKGRNLWTPTPADPFGDPDRCAARLELARGRLDVAEALAAASLRRWQGGRQLSRTHTRIVQATIHVTAGEQRGLQLAHQAIVDAARLTSVRARSELVPLAESLQARPGSDARELARMARQVAA